jgi:hypothetical protein
MASTRTIFGILEKGLDEVPAPGLKSVVGVVGEILKALQVRGARMSEPSSHRAYRPVWKTRKQSPN